MNRRLSILKYWLSGRRNGVSPGGLIRFLCDPTCTVKAKKVIKEMREDGDYVAVYLKGFKQPIYFPKGIDLYHLYTVVAEGFYSHDWHYYEAGRTRIAADDCVVDCGAAEGLFSLLAAQRCSKVYAIEPLPKYIKGLRKTFRDFNNVTIIPFALSDRSGNAYIVEKGKDSFVSLAAGSGDGISVSSIDDLFFAKRIRVDYIKADLEGSEVAMLKGAENTIRTYKPRIAITTYHDASHAFHIERYLKGVVADYNIKVKGIDGSTGSPVMLHAWVD